MPFSFGWNPAARLTIDLAAGDQYLTGSFVQSVAPSGAGTTSGMLGYVLGGGPAFDPRDEHIPTRHVPGWGRHRIQHLLDTSPHASAQAELITRGSGLAGRCDAAAAKRQLVT